MLQKSLIFYMFILFLVSCLKKDSSTYGLQTIDLICIDNYEAKHYDAFLSSEQGLRKLSESCGVNVDTISFKTSIDDELFSYTVYLHNVSHKEKLRISSIIDIKIKEELRTIKQ